jgi:GNAT superfamily N-acetyltransferase
MVGIRLVKHLAEMEQLVDLFRVCFELNMSPELWNWKYLQNPLASAAPEVIVALDDGKVVGARPFLLTEMWLDNERVVTAQHCDTMVHPEHRNKGIFSRMGQFAIQYLKENNYILSYGFPGPMSSQGFLTQGWRIVAPTEIMFRIVNPQRAISRKLKSKILGNGLGFFYDKLLNTKITENLRLSSAFHVEIFDRFTGELNEVDTLRDELCIDMVRSETNLRWRFDGHPEHSYKYILAKRDEKVWGYAVISVQVETNGLVYGMITDHLVKNRDIACFQALMESSLNELGKSGCDILVMWMFSEPKFREQLLKYFGFKSSFRFPYDKIFGYGYLDAILIDERVAERINIYDSENWRVTYAFSDST